MAHTFDIRFGRSVGLSGLFEAPENSFRWKGSGSLRIDREGISIAVKRGLHSLFPRAQRVAAADLKEVLREGDALRVEFSTNKLSRVVLPFWVRDQHTAAEIVRLLPTTNTVELDHDAAGVGSTRFRVDWRVVSLVGVLLLGMSGLAVLRIGSETQASVVADASRIPADRKAEAPGIEAAPPGVKVEAPGENPRVAIVPPAASGAVEVRAQAIPPPIEPDPATLYTASETATPDISAAAESMVIALDEYAAPPRRVAYARMTEGVVPIVPEMAVYEAARRQLEIFRNEVGPLDRLDNVNKLSLWNATVRIYNDPGLDHPDLWALRDMELAVSRAWRSCYDMGSPACEFAQRLTKRLELYVRP